MVMVGVWREAGARRVQFNQLAGEHGALLDQMRRLMAARTLASPTSDHGVLADAAVFAFEVGRAREDLREVRRSEVRRRGHAVMGQMSVVSSRTTTSAR